MSKILEVESSLVQVLPSSFLESNEIEFLTPEGNSEKQLVSNENFEESQKAIKALRLELIQVRSHIKNILEMVKRRHLEERKAATDNFKVFVEQNKLTLLKTILATGALEGSIQAEVSGPNDLKQMITVEVKRNSDRKYLLSDAMSALERAKMVPELLLVQQTKEIQEYEKLNDIYTDAQREIREAEKAFVQDINSPKLLERKMANCDGIVRNAIEKIKSSLKSEEGLAISPIKSTAEENSYKRLTNEKEGIVLTTRIYTDLFVPSKEEFLKLQKDFKKLSPILTEERVLVLDSTRFILISEDLQRVSAEGFVEPEKWGAEVVSNSEKRCIVLYRGKRPPTYMNIRIKWLLTQTDRTKRIMFQFDNYRPLPIADILSSTKNQSLPVYQIRLISTVITKGVR